MLGSLSGERHLETQDPGARCAHSHEDINTPQRGLATCHVNVHDMYISCYISLCLNMQFMLHPILFLKIVYHLNSKNV